MDGDNASEDVTSTSLSKDKKPGHKNSELPWPYHITVDISTSAQPKIAFLSGEERKYYPENPGHSKLAQVFVSNSHKDNIRGPSTEHKPIEINKPISKLGYGIGGLLVERFQKLGSNERRPGPGSHQTIHMYSPRPNLSDIKNPLVVKQCKVSFGMTLAMPRFGRNPYVMSPGPGTYSLDMSGSCKRLKSEEAFGSRHCITPTTMTVCTFTEAEKCSECGMEQRHDYYRSKGLIKNHHVHDRSTPASGELEMVVLCRKCYHRTFNGRHATWKQKNLVARLFHKCRHCNYTHEHRNLPLYISKARVKEIKKLSAKESILAKYFSDSVTEVKR